MSKFSKGKKRKDPAISTAALPDIVFMLLFFFMVTTVFKEKESNKILIEKVTIKETVDLEKNVKAAYYWIGKVPGEFTAKGEPLYKTQLDDDLINDNSEIRNYLNKLKKNPEFAQVWDSKFFNVFKVDKDTKMRLVREIQDELKEAEAFKVVYSVQKDKQKK
jgi:biopolymer transport protein ExbD